MDNTEKNKIIAEFMGAYISKKGKEAYDLDTKFPNGSDRLLPENMLYTSDWNWLMEVVEKTKAVGYLVHFDLQFIGCEISVIDIDGNVVFSTHPKNNTQEKQLINCVYDAVLNFINWYNSQKN